MISIPAGHYFWVLLGLLPGVWLAARWLLDGMPPMDRRILAPVLAAAMFVLATHVAALISHSFYVGVATAAIVLGLVGYAFLPPLVLRGRAGVGAIGGGDSPHPNPPPAYQGRGSDGETSERVPRRVWLVWAAGAVAMIAPIFAYNFYDEYAVPGHQSTASQILNGDYPPAYLPQPAIEFRYHYGLDLLVAAVQLLLHVRVDQAIDVVAVLCWLMVSASVWLLGERLLGRGAGVLLWIVVAFGGGFAYFGQAGIKPPWVGPYQIHGSDMLLPFTAICFQKAWSLGVPLWCLAILLLMHCTSAARRDERALTALAVVTAAMAIVQVTIFGTWVLGCAACLLPRYLRQRDGRVMAAGLIVAAAALAATRLHGFFAPAHSAIRGILGTGMFGAVGSGGIAGDWRDSVMWNLLSFGLRLPLGIAGLLLIRQSRLLAAMGLIAAVALNCFKFPFTADINKFATIVSIALSAGTAALLHRWWQSGRVAAKLGVATLLAAIVPAGVLFVAAHWIGRGYEQHRAIEPYWTVSYPIDADDAAAISWLRGQVRPPENLYRRQGVADKYCWWGGLPTVWPPVWARGLGMSQQTLAARNELVVLADHHDPHFLAKLRQQDVAWVVVDPTEPWLTSLLEAQADAGAAGELKQFGSLRIFRLK